MLTPEQIRQKREYLADFIAEHQTEIAKARAEMEMLQKRCKHPAIHKYSCMGEIGDCCEDCGYQT